MRRSFAWLSSAILTAVLSAHVFPISYGLLNLGGGKARFRLRISVHNLHPALEAFTGSHLEMRDEGYEARLLEAYFKGRLEWISPQGRVVRMRVLHQELGIEEIVFALEAPLPTPKGWKLRNTLLFEQSTEQKNYVTVEEGSHRLGLTFDAQHPVLPVVGP